MMDQWLDGISFVMKRDSVLVRTQCERTYIIFPSDL